MNRTGIPKIFSRKEKSVERKRSGERVREKTDAVAVGWDAFFARKENPDNNAHFKAVESQIPRLRNYAANKGFEKLDKGHYRYALRSQYAVGDIGKAFELLVLIRDSVEGIIRSYNPKIELRGAQNRENVTCYLDALLFGMFVRLDCFEVILYNTFRDEPRRNLSCLLRLWVNMLRSGKLIHQDIAKQLQDALAACGWQEAALKKQQDTSEAFTFITEVLELPLLTLKMDIYHTGKEEAGDDHRFVNERLLHVAIPTQSSDGAPIKLESCLETYFISRIDVKRHNERSSTLSSIKSSDSLRSDHSHPDVAPRYNDSPLPPTESLDAVIEKSRELKESLISQNSPSERPTERPTGRKGSQSLVRERFFSDTDDDSDKSKHDLDSTKPGRKRKGSIRKEVMMPAWQVFSLIPWYTDNRPTNDPELAVHFSEKRPILGICLKRYANAPGSGTTRLDTYVDIPTEIGLPHFIKDDLLEENGPLFGNFKLSLQAVVCHRGDSVDSGHYISLARGTNEHIRTSTDERPPSDRKNCWLRFDDIGVPRVTMVDIEKALKDEVPYLLFYQILPIGADENSIGPPPYTEIDENIAYPTEKGAIAISSDSSDDESYVKESSRTSLSQTGDTTDRIKSAPQDPVSGTNRTNNFLSPPRNTSMFKRGKTISRPESIIGDTALGATLSRWRRRSADPLVPSGNRGNEEQDEDKRPVSLDLSEVSSRINKSVTPPERKKKKGKRPDRECVVM